MRQQARCPVGHEGETMLDVRLSHQGAIIQGPSGTEKDGVKTFTASIWQQKDVVEQADLKLSHSGPDVTQVVKELELLVAFFPVLLLLRQKVENKSLKI